jgi:hypothetical protein
MHPSRKFDGKYCLPVVKHFVEQFVHDDNVILDSGLGAFIEVVDLESML